MSQIQEETQASVNVGTARDLALAGGRWWVDRQLRFYDYLRVEGWASREGMGLVGVFLVYDGEVKDPGQTGLPSPDVPWDPNCRFVLTAIWPGEFDPGLAALAFEFSDGSAYVLRWEEISAANELALRTRAGGESTNRAHNVFFDLLRKNGAKSVLEIGSRARSGIVRRGLFPGLDYLGVDILAGENVDVVGDAHELSRILGGRTFDAVYTTSTFEHLLMPWKVGLEINRVLNAGGLLFACTHQALGMHDLPWDYWRFSDTAWHGLFNRYTGFEILATHLGEPMHLVPFDFEARWNGFEGAVGFAASAVTCRKIGETSLAWDVPNRDIALGSYPAGEIPVAR